jgi:lincosamide nucleotidyltransferase A/C/D/E
MMNADDVIEVTGRLERAGLRYWLDGGWGVDALVGEQSREHDDLDVVVELSAVGNLVALLGPLGFRITIDERPTRLVLSDSGDRRIDLHLITLDERGAGRQAGAGPGGGDAVYPASGLTGRGWVAGGAVNCLTPELLLLHHTGYEPKARDRHNVRMLCERFGLRPPPSFAE